MPAAEPVAAIELDYPVRPRSRYGWGAPPHPQLQALLVSGTDHYRTVLEGFLAHAGELASVTVDAPESAGDPQWGNDYLPGLDAVALYAFVADLAPALYLEVGSGNSTKFAARAIRDHALPTRVVSIDPFPRAEIDALCDEVIRQPAEDVDLAVYDALAAGDILFIDNSHRVLQNSDATVMLTEVVPALAPGVLVGIHDIFLPEDYPPQWADRWYSEQYLLAAWLLGRRGRRRDRAAGALHQKPPRARVDLRSDLGGPAPRGRRTPRRSLLAAHGLTRFSPPSLRAPHIPAGRTARC